MFRNQKKEYFKEYYRRQDKILKLINQNFENHDSGMDYCCVSCLRLHNRNNVSKYKKNINEDKDKKLLLIAKTSDYEEHHYLCNTCRPALIKGWPRLNFIKLHDIDNIGSLSRKLPDLNLMEQYLLKLTIPFIRVAHVPRSPLFKLIGGSICIQADISHSMERLNINPETIIPVSFRRKLSYKGHYLEQVINKEKVFKWLAFLKENNHLFKDILSESKVSEEIDDMSAELMDELVTYDEYRVLKDQLDESKQKEEKIITEDIIEDSSDSEDDEGNALEDVKTEEIGNIYKTFNLKTNTLIYFR